MEKIKLDTSSYQALFDQLEQLFGSGCGYYWYYSNDDVNYWTYNTPHNMRSIAQSKHYGNVSALLYELDKGKKI